MNDWLLLVIHFRWRLCAIFYTDELKEQMGEKFDEYVKKLPVFSTDYQAWYSESMALIKQLLPDALDDFTMHYKNPGLKKALTTEN